MGGNEGVQSSEIRSLDYLLSSPWRHAPAPLPLPSCYRIAHRHAQAHSMSMLAKVEALRETAATAVGPVKKAVNADLEVAVHALLGDLAFRKVDEAERQSVEESLSTHAVALKLALLRALGVSALHRALVLQPVLLESMRRMLCTVPHAGAAGILEKALGADIDASTDLCAAARTTSLRRLPGPPACAASM